MITMITLTCPIKDQTIRRKLSIHQTIVESSSREQPSCAYRFITREDRMSPQSKTQQPPQKQDRQPGLESEMKPRPKADDHSYRGSAKLQEKVALITRGDSGIGRAGQVLHPIGGTVING
jgi:hypothetical protein